MKNYSKSVIALAVSTVFLMFSVAHADMNQAIDLVDALAAHKITFSEGQSMWATFDDQTRSEARQYDQNIGHNLTSDYVNVPHTNYARGVATPGYVGDSSTPINHEPTQRPATILPSNTMEPSIIKESNPAGKSTNQIGPATHLDGTHSEPVTPHLDASANIDRSSHLDGVHSEPATPHLDADTNVDRSTHLDSNVTDQQRQTAQLNAAIEHANTVTNGKNGADGKDGVTTIVTRVETDNATQSKVATNETLIRESRSEQVAQGEFIQREAVAIDQNSAAITSNAQRIDNNSQRIDRNAKRIDETREDLKKGLNNAAAMTGLHYHSNDAYAISAGTANGEGAALAGGLSHGFTPHTAATVQASTSMDGGYMASVGFSGDF